MEFKKIHVIIVLIILVLLAGYSVFSNLNSNKEIKRLTLEIEITTDSLSVIHGKLSSVAQEYDSVVSELEITKTNLKGLKLGIDSVMRKNINSVKYVNSALKGLLDKQKSVDTLSTNNNNSGSIFQ